MARYPGGVGFGGDGVEQMHSARQLCLKDGQLTATLFPLPSGFPACELGCFVTENIELIRFWFWPHAGRDIPRLSLLSLCPSLPSV